MTGAQFKAARQARFLAFEEARVGQKQNPWSLRAVARRSGVSTQTISNYEAGHNVRPWIEKKIGRVFA